MKLMGGLKEDLLQFCSNCSIHGLANITNAKLSHFQRGAWMIVLTFALLILGICIKHSVDDWKNEPKITTIESPAYPVTNIPFPTVTICHQDNEININEFLAKLLDFVDYPCFDNGLSSSSCNDDGFPKYLADYVTTNLFNGLISKYKDISVENNLNFYKHQEKEIQKFIDILIFHKDGEYKKFLDYVVKNMPHVPGLFKPDVDSVTRYRDVYLPLIKNLSRNKMNSIPIGLTLATNFNKSEANLKENLMEAVAMIKAISEIYNYGNVSNDFLQTRPDFYFGRFYSIFADFFKDEGTLNYKCDNQIGSQAVSLLQYIYNDFETLHFRLFYCHSNDYECSTISAEQYSCPNITNSLLANNITFFLDFVKMAYPFIHQSTFNYSQSIRDYVGKSMFLQKTALREPKHLSDLPDMITLKWDDSLEDSTFDEKIFPFITPAGLCSTFNAKSLNKIYNQEGWSTFSSEINFESDIIQSSKPLTIILNMNRYVPWTENLKSMKISITNADNPFYVYKHNYIIQPGRLYKFNVIPQMIVSTERFRQMSLSDRKCRLKSEIEGLNMFKQYSKAACEMECEADHAMKECQCIPWYIPKSNNISLPYCNIKDRCFINEMRKKASNISSCSCWSDCEGISFAMVPSSREINLPANACTAVNSSEIFAHEMCKLCVKVVKHFKIRLIYNHLYNGHPHPDNLDEFCQFFVKENVAIVQVQFASDSFIRSVTDKRFKLVDQISSLGGTLGLFVGMTIMTFFEIMELCVKFLHRLLSTLSRNRIKRKPNQ